MSPDPWSEDDSMAHVCEEREGCIYHIEFLGKQHTHNWIIEEKVFTKSGSKWYFSANVSECPSSTACIVGGTILWQSVSAAAGSSEEQQNSEACTRRGGRDDETYPTTEVGKMCVSEEQHHIW